uniref:BTB domain-containing protein n=1 Tax=Tetradesmus obliquus TaxID=3088 RepID=A0A383VNZ1_TETOB|eukprot:jgi/Sobl393_1/8519/SZX66539.1
MYSTEALLHALSTYANYGALPRELIVSAINAWNSSRQAEHAGIISSGIAPSVANAAEEELQQAFLQALASTVPLEWTVTKHNAFKTDSKMQASMHGQAVGTPYGLICFGGMVLGRLAELKVQNEISWIREHQGHMLAPDYSTVFQGTPSQLSSQVVTISPADSSSSSSSSSRSSRSSSPWAATPASPALPAGLIGHSVALYGSRVFIFGGMEAAAAAQPDSEADAPPKAAAKAKGPAAKEPAPKKPTGRTSNKLRAYAVDESGTQGGMLPILSELPQLGQQPSSRMYHRAAVDPEAGVMYVYGGVHIRDRDGARLPADEAAGTLHCYCFHSYTWSTLQTAGSYRPRSTTLLAFWWHNGALWAIPDVPLHSSSSSSRRSGSSSSRQGAGSSKQGASSSRHASSSHKADQNLLCGAQPGYQLLRLDMISNEWELVPTQGEPPCLRTHSCSVYCNSKLMIYGGKTARTPVSMLCDLRVLDLQQQPPTWQLEAPRLAVSSSSVAGMEQQQQQQPLLGLAGHCGGADAEGCVVFYGGYRRNDLKEPQAVLQVLEYGVKPPTPDAALLSGAAAAPMLLALQHVRLQLARVVRQHHPQQVLLRPDGNGGVRMPARLLALYSCLFDDMFQDMLQQEDENAAGNAEPQVVPVPGASLSGVACVCRWVMGLLALGSCSMTQLVDMYRVADRLIMERLMVELLELLAAADISGPQQAAAVLQLTGDLSGRADVAGLGAHATSQLTQQVCAATAPGIMALAQQHSNQQLQERCIEVMHGHRKNDVFAVLDFALRFRLPRLQGSCLAHLSQVTRGRLIDKAERIVKAASRYVTAAVPLCRLPVVSMLEKDLLLELGHLEEQVSSLPSYAAAAQRLGLVRLAGGVTEACARPEVWRQLQQNKQVLQHMQQKFPELLPKQEAGGAAAAAAGGARGRPAQTSLLGQL